MGTQILAGSIGKYKPISPEIFGEVRFAVTEDTCMEAEKLPVCFLDVGYSTWISFADVSEWVEKHTQDY